VTGTSFSLPYRAYGGFFGYKAVIGYIYQFAVGKLFIQSEEYKMTPKSTNRKAAENAAKEAATEKAKAPPIQIVTRQVRSGMVGLSDPAKYPETAAKQMAAMKAAAEKAAADRAAADAAAERAAADAAAKAAERKAAIKKR